MPGFPEYGDYDAPGLADPVRRGDVASGELVDAAAQAIDVHNPRLNAVIHTCFEQARNDADQIDRAAPFAGVPFLPKDLLSGYAGEPLGNGSRAYRNYVPTAHAPLIERYLAVGFVVVGKTNTPELGLMPVTEPAARGPSRKPWDPARTPGGSSGGAGAAVASGMVPAAHGGDGGGSIRIPAACCGLFGLKPSRGRMPNSPPCDVWLDGVIEHGLTRSVRDSAALLDVSALGERESRLPRPGSGFLAEVGQPAGPMRVAVVREPLLEATFTKDCHDALEVACKLCADLGYELIEAEPEIDRKRFATAFARMLCAEVAAELRQAAVILKRRVRRDEFEVITWALGLLGRAIPAGRAVSTHSC
jgi:amidase